MFCKSSMGGVVPPWRNNCAESFIKSETVTRFSCMSGRVVKISPVLQKQQNKTSWTQAKFACSLVTITTLVRSEP